MAFARLDCSGYSGTRAVSDMQSLTSVTASWMGGR